MNESLRITPKEIDAVRSRMMAMAVMAVMSLTSWVQGQPLEPRPSTAGERVCLERRTVRSGESHTQGREVTVGPFCIDRTLVTRSEFARFVRDTNYVTSAERHGYGLESVEGMDDWAWRRVIRGSWRRPFREENQDTRGFLRDDVPVVMVSWFDAVAYCAWKNARLPTEDEWQYAMAAGEHRARYPWGDSPNDSHGRPRLNFWQGESHHRNQRTDGYVYVSPVRAFAPNAWGLYDPVGNVWQWTASPFSPPQPTHPGRHTPQRVLRGGSWWCAACTCEAYGLSYRGHADPRAAFSNNGFRCVTDTPRESSP